MLIESFNKELKTIDEDCINWRKYGSTHYVAQA